MLGPYILPKRRKSSKEWKLRDANAVMGQLLSELADPTVAQMIHSNFHLLMLQE